MWAGMAKETAHQIGTPLSSMMAWIEILRSKPDLGNITTELDKDVKRLETITERFSKIGLNLNYKWLIFLMPDEYCELFTHRLSNKVTITLNKETLSSTFL